MPVDEHPRSARAARHAAHKIQSLHRAVRVVNEATGLDEPSSIAALEVVISGLVRRLTPAEGRQLLAQLPTELRESLRDLPPGPEDGLTRGTIEAELARRLALEPEVAAELVPKVGIAVRHLVSEGEMTDVLAQLPDDMKSMLPDEVLHQNP